MINGSVFKNQVENEQANRSTVLTLSVYHFDLCLPVNGGHSQIYRSITLLLSFILSRWSGKTKGQAGSQMDLWNQSRCRATLNPSMQGQGFMFTLEYSISSLKEFWPVT